MSCESVPRGRYGWPRWHASVPIREKERMISPRVSRASIHLPTSLKPHTGRHVRARRVCGRPPWCKQDSEQLVTAAKVLSYVRPLDAAFIRRGPIWCTWTGSKSLQRARSPARLTGFSDPVFNDLLPLCCLSSSPHRPGLSADRALEHRFRRARVFLSFPGSHPAAAIAAGVR